MRCPECGSSSYDSDYKCLVCGHLVSSPSINPVGSIEGESLGADFRRRDEGETKATRPNESDYNPLLGLLSCPQCSQRALFWNRHDQIYKCVNPKCKQRFTIEEYKNREVQVRPKEQQSEQIPSDVPRDKAKERIKRTTKSGKHKQVMKLGITEQMPSGVATIEANEKTPELGITEQMPSGAEIIEVNEKMWELGITEQMPSGVATIEANEKTSELGITEQMPSGVATIEVNEKT